jgi:hypothetical protein
MWNTVLKEWFGMKAKNDSTAAHAVVILTGDAR